MVSVHDAEDLSTVLLKVLPNPNTVVDFHIGREVWDQAILEALATFATAESKLPVDVREAVEEFLRKDGVSPKFRKRARFNLDRIPV